MKRYSWLFYLAVVITGISGFSLLIIPFLLPYQAMRSLIDEMSLDHSASIITLHLYTGLITVTSIAGLMMLFTAGVLCYKKRQILPKVIEVRSSFIKGLIHVLNHLRPDRKDTPYLIILTGIMLLAALMRIVFLSQPMRYDESYTFLYFVDRFNPFSVRSLINLLSNYSYPNNHIFHTFLVFVAYHVLGNQPWVLRLPALLAGILLAPATYLTASLMYDRKTALLSSGLVACSSILIEFSTNARGYTLICLLFLIELALAIYLKQNRNWVAWFLFDVVTALGFFTIPIMLYPFGVVITWLFLSMVAQDIIYTPWILVKVIVINCIAIFFLSALMYLPAMVVSGINSIIHNQFIESKPLLDFLQMFPGSLDKIIHQWNRDIPLLIRVLLFIGFMLSLIFHKQLSHHRVPIVSAVIIWCICSLVIQRVVPYARVWLFLLPLYFVVSASGITWAIRKLGIIPIYRTSLFAISCVIIFTAMSFSVISSKSIYYSNETGLLRDGKNIVIYLKGVIKSEDCILQDLPTKAPLSYYFRYFNLGEVPILYDKGFENCSRVWILVNDDSGQKIETLLDKENLGQRVNTADIHPVHEFSGAHLFVFENKYTKMPN